MNFFHPPGRGLSVSFSMRAAIRATAEAGSLESSFSALSVRVSL
jgi:hypothetical protein